MYTKRNRENREYLKSAGKDKLVKAIELIDGVTHKPWPSREDGFSTLHFANKEIGHFHHFSELDLKLGKNLIQQQGLQHPRNSKHHPKRSANSAFIELPVHCDADQKRIVDLIQLFVESTTHQN